MRLQLTKKKKDPMHSRPGVGKLFSGKDREYPRFCRPDGACHNYSDLLWCEKQSGAICKPRAWLSSSSFVYKNKWHLASGLCRLPTPAGKFCKSCVKKKKEKDKKGYGKRQEVLLEQWNHRYIVEIPISLLLKKNILFI